MENKFNVGNLVEGKFINIQNQLGVITRTWESVSYDDRVDGQRRRRFCCMALVHWADGQKDMLCSSDSSYDHVKVIL